MTRASLLNDDVHQRVVDGFRAGQTAKVCAEYGGIRPALLQEWLDRGAAYDELLIEGGEGPEGDHRYWMLWQDCQRAIAEVKISAAGTLRRAWQSNDWRAALAWLERMQSEDFLKAQKVEMTGADGGAIRVADVTETERRLAGSVRQALEAAAAAPQLEQVLDVVAIEDRSYKPAGPGPSSPKPKPPPSTPWEAQDDEEEDIDPYAPWSAQLGLGESSA